ncbi:MAG: HAMP domain-containing sensor histidine kinase, partial [Terriglobus sp.]
SEEAQKRILEPFYTTKGAAGTGLGLSICAEIVQRHGGALVFESSTVFGRSGTTFSVTLPIRMSSEAYVS